MSRKRHTPEQIIPRLREAEVALAQGEKVAAICRRLGITEQTYYRWRKEYGGLKMDQTKRMKELEKEVAAGQPPDPKHAPGTNLASDAMCGEQPEPLS